MRTWAFRTLRWNTLSERVAARWDIDLAGGTVEAEFHIKNQMKLLLTVTTSTEKTDRKPETQAPEGAASMSLEDLTGW